MLHNTAGTEGGGFHQRTEYFRGAGTQRESRNGTLHVLVRIGGAAAVHPVQGDNTVLGGFHVLGLTGEFHQHAVQNFLPGLPSGDIFQCPCQHLPEPGVDVSESRLPGFETDESRKHRTVHLAADSLDTASAYLVFAGNHDVAGGCSHDTCQYPRGDGCAYGSHMGVQRPHGHGDSSGKSKPVCPLGCQFPCLGVAGVGFCEQMGEHFLQGRIKFNIGKRYLKFLVGGGSQADRTSVNLVVDGKIVETAVGNQTETLSETVWDLKPYQGKKDFVKVIDLDVYPWGHILADQFVLTDNRNEDIYNLSSTSTLLADFESNSWGDWQVVDSSEEEKQFLADEGDVEATYRPWYSERFKSLNEVIGYWDANQAMLEKNSRLFSDAFYSSSLPAEVLEAVATNLTILKSPTVLRQWDGRFWAWEGCQDSFGSCHGSCTHVWNYAQALPHLFPSLERTLRETEFRVSQNTEGHQNFRVNLPISAPPHNFHAAADGQLGGIMKVYREWRISGDTQWMKDLFPAVKKSLDYCIRTWDPLHKGYLEEPHHNTYDIEFWGPDGMCTSFYLGALTAFIEMGKELKQPVKEYTALLSKGKKYMETALFDGEYFIQKIQWEGLQAPNPVDVMSFGGSYSDEALKLLKEEGPKYQYGTGCLSDGILGMWMASVCGLDEVLDNEKVRSHLVAVHKYNLKHDLVDHFNPQRPVYACGKDGGLLLCTWPKGGMLSLPFVYSNEVWTGIEYQVASHLMMKGEVEKGLDIVRECRERYDGRVRNPFNEIECGHWYARAMASYGMLQGLTGVRYDAVDKTMYINSKIGDFKSFISTDTGFGTIEWKAGKPVLNVVYGNIDVKRYNVSGKIVD